MCSLKLPELGSGLFLLVLLALCIVPVHAQNGIVTISYRGAGGYYVGDSIIFDGRDTVGNQTVFVLTGPGLPAQGVPPYTINGAAGTGNTVIPDSTGAWSFEWDTSRAQAIGSLTTAAFTVTAYDASDPMINSSVSVFLKQPGFSATISPNPAVLNDYIQVIGRVEIPADSIQINVLDASGNKVHTFQSPVSAGGYFQYGFHVDMPPGAYTVTIGSPSVPTSLTQTLIIVASNANLTSSGTGSVPSVPLATATTGTAQTPSGSSSGAGTIVISSTPAGASVYLDSALVGTSPVSLNSVPPGTHLVEIKSPGYLTVSMNVVVSSDKPTQIAPQMVKAPFGMPLSVFAAVGGCLGAALIFIGRKKLA